MPLRLRQSLLTALALAGLLAASAPVAVAGPPERADEPLEQLASNGLSELLQDLLDVLGFGGKEIRNAVAGIGPTIDPIGALPEPPPKASPGEEEGFTSIGEDETTSSPQGG